MSPDRQPNPTGSLATLTRDQVRELDRLAIEQLAIPGIVLMENAALNATYTILDWLQARTIPPDRRPRIAIVCGSGNNAGDGYAIARHLHNRGLHVHIDALKDPAKLTGDAAINARICRNMALPIRSLDQPDPPAAIDHAAREWAAADLLIDAMLGTGFHGSVRQPLATAIERINALPGPDRPAVVAIDVPSGLDCQTGQPAQTTIRAALTITFAARKLGFDAPAAQPFLGKVQIADIGTPPELIHQITTSTTDT